MRDFWDIRFGRAKRSDDIAPAAYSRDGYLIDQGKLSGISYGRKTSRETGCGWIACFNFLRFMNRPQPPQEVARRMERMLLWGGRIGSHPLAVWWYLHQKGFRFRTAFTCWGPGGCWSGRRGGPRESSHIGMGRGRILRHLSGRKPWFLQRRNRIL